MTNLEQHEILTGLAGRGYGAGALVCAFPETVGSTNDECLQLLRSGAKRAMVLADAQSAGRGRCGRSFYSPPGAGLYLSVGCVDWGGAEGLTSFAAVAAAERIEALTGLKCQIKWVNDLYLDGRKVCGILTEAVGGCVIVGIGINLTASAVPEELRDVMGWLGRGGVRAPLAAELTAALLDFRPGDTTHMAEYRRRSLVLGKDVKFLLNGVERDGRATDVRDDGALVVLSRGERVVLQSGEVSIKI
ncbi:MAG: biotin--[Oscillospiraceae bacterium]|nr:biotin--[acetyl-CoA-carboxylase] ligase [Oscillospiraceae bacterium]